MKRLSSLKKLLIWLKKHSKLLILLNLLLIIILTWMPFNFAIPLNFSWLTVIKEFRETPYTSNTTDITANVLFFIPFGVAWGAWFANHLKLNRWFTVLIVVSLLSFSLSLTVETGQLFLVCREPGLMDLATNSLGGLLGASMFLLIERFQQLVIRFLQMWAIFRRPQILLRILIILWLAYLGLMSWLLIDVADRNQLDNWQPDFPLVIGNENTGDRPWTGTINQLCIADRSLDLTHIRQAIGKNLCQKLVQTAEFSSHYDFAPFKQNYPDLAQNSPALQSLKTTISDKNLGITLGEHNWLKSITPPVSLNQRIKASSQFTLITEIAPDNFQQEGPARIISLSQDLHHRNLTIAQSRQDLSLRLRMPFTGSNGKQPEIRLNKFFLDTKPHTKPHPLAIIYDGWELHFISDRSIQTLYLGSEAALFWSVFGIIGEKMFLIVNVDWLNKILYYSFIFAPLGVSFGLIYRLLKTSQIGAIALIISGLVVPPLLIEGMIISTSDRNFSWQYPLLGLAVLSISFCLTRFSPRIGLTTAD